MSSPSYTWLVKKTIESVPVPLPDDKAFGLRLSHELGFDLGRDVNGQARLLLSA